jgi:hypothetical protein
MAGPNERRSTSDLGRRHAGPNYPQGARRWLVEKTQRSIERSRVARSEKGLTLSTTPSSIWLQLEKETGARRSEPTPRQDALRSVGTYVTEHTRLFQ